MRQHIQGLILLIVMLLVLWVTTSMAGPVISDAFSGEDSALHAESADVVPPGEEDDIPIPLTSDEVLEYQAALTELGYDPGSIDGLMGPSTKTAAAQALLDRGLPSTTGDRDLLEVLKTELGITDPTDALDPDSEAVDPTEPVVEDEFVNEPEPGVIEEG